MGSIDATVIDSMCGWQARVTSLLCVNHSQLSCISKGVADAADSEGKTLYIYSRYRKFLWHAGERFAWNVLRAVAGVLSKAALP